jgi:kynurenine formamidase
MKIHDLSLPVYDRVPGYPAGPKTVLIRHFSIETMGRNTTQILMSAHQGTHVDAPLHFVAGGKTIETIGVDRLVCRVVLVDMAAKKAKEPIDVDDFRPWEDAVSRVRRLVIRTGWDKRYPEPEYFTDHPFVTPALAARLVEMGVRFVGLDFPSPAAKWEDCVATHRAFLGGEVVIAEGLANLDRLGSKEFLLAVLPVLLLGCEGAPARAVGIEFEPFETFEDAFR